MKVSISLTTYEKLIWKNKLNIWKIVKIEKLTN